MAILKDNGEVGFWGGWVRTQEQLRDDCELRLVDRRRRAQDRGGGWPLEPGPFGRLRSAHRHQYHILNCLGFQPVILGLLLLFFQLTFQV